MAVNYEIDYNDDRFKDVEADKKVALNEVDKTYGEMISQSDKYYQDQIDAAKDYADKQTALQNQQTNQTINEINQQKAQAKKDYTREQSGAYVDWQQQSNQYGANAEAMAAQGMTKTGFAESSQVSMYNTYQNRVATARESYNLAIQNYNNAITQAQLQNNSILAEIAYNALQQQLELSLQGFQYKNQLLLAQADKKTEINNIYYQRYQDVVNQINTENALAEQVRQADLEDARAKAALAEEKRQADLDEAFRRAQLEEQKRQANLDDAYKKAQLEEQKRQFGILHSSTGSSGGGGGSGKGGMVEKSPATGKSRVDNDGRGIVDKDGNKVSNNSGNTGDDLPIDFKSITEAGFSGRSAAEIDRLVRQGILEEYVADGKRKFRRSAYTNKQFQLIH